MKNPPIMLAGFSFATVQFEPGDQPAVLAAAGAAAAL
jgi:hypothetical protein